MNQRIRLWDLPGGIQLPPNKMQSVQQPIRPGPLPDTLILPLQQPGGACARPLVQVGETVLKGQKIAAADGLGGLPLHASSSGSVVAIGPAPVQHPSHLQLRCITLRTDGQEKRAPTHGVTDYTALEREQVLALIHEAGIAGMGGAGFPTAIKLGIGTRQPVEQLILNAAECEPYLTADDMLMRERASDVVAGLAIMAWLVQPSRILIGIEDNKPEAIAAMKKAVIGSGFDVIVMPTKYPSGSEKQIIQLLTGKEVPTGQLPTEAGVICQNAATAYAVARAILHGEPLISRITTVTGEAVRDKGNYELLIGTPVISVLQHAGFDSTRLRRLLMGGPMMGQTLQDLTVPVVNTTQCLLAASATELPDPLPELPCIRCGACAQVCPVSLLPQQLYWFSKSADHDKAQSFHLFDCIECGACAYVCPSHIPLVQYFRHEMGEIRLLEQEKATADRARARYEARKIRDVRDEREQDDRRRLRAQAAAEKQKASIDAAINTTPAKTTGNANLAASVAAPHPLTVLKTAYTTAQKRWKDAEKAMQVARQSGTANIDAMRDKVEKLRVKSEEARLNYENARSSVPTPTPAAAKPTEDGESNTMSGK